MLRIRLGASGEEVACLDVSQLREDGKPTFGSLKRYLARKHFQQKYSRFQLRLLREGDSSELEDFEIITAPLDLQLVLMSHLVPEEERDSRFRDRCLAHDLVEVERSLEELQNPDLDEDEPLDRPLCFAAAHGHTRLARLLLEAGASLNAPLHFAASNGHAHIVQLLLEFGAAIDSEGPEGMTPLHSAAFRGHVKLARVLLDRGAQLEAMNLQGQRPLHVAASGGHLETVRLLLDYGAEKGVADSAGQTPSQLAAAEGHGAVAELLRGKRRRVETST